MAKVDIQKKITGRIEQLKSEISHLQTQLQEWERISSDYQVNKTTIESILSLHEAPDLSAGTKKPKKTSVK